MRRTRPQSKESSVPDIILPGGQGGASIMLSYSTTRLGGDRICKPYASLVYNLHDGRIIVDTYNRDTEKFEEVIETNLATLFGLEGSSEEPPSCKLAHMKE
jgi:hypothetical protein